MTDHTIHETKRHVILMEADRLIHGDRQKHYGEPAENFAVIAAMWSAYLGHTIQPRDVANLMALLKIARLRNGPHEDSATDGAAYLAIGAELA